MFEINPFAELAVTVPAGIMQGFVTVMIALVAGGTIFDIIHKGSAKYFFQRWSREKGLKQRDPGFDEKIASVAKTTAHDVLTSGEFCNFKRRLAHLLTMYGFIAYAVATAVMVFFIPDQRYCHASLLASDLVARQCNGLRGRLLVLVFHPC